MSAPRRLARASVLAGLVLADPAAAYRPFDGTDADVADVHVLELELGPGQVRRQGGRTAWVPSLVVNWGLVRGCELVLDAGAAGVLAGRPGGEPFSLEAGLALKTLLRPGSLQDGRGPSVALEPELLVPGTDGGGGAGVSVGLIASERWTAAVLHLNLAPAWTRAHRWGLLASLIAEGAPAARVRPVGELLLELERGRAGPRASGLLGLVWRAQDGLAPDGAVRAGSDAGAWFVEVRLGVTWDAVAPVGS